MIGEADKYQEFVERYRAYGDVELLQLAASAGDLTEAAQQALTNEMAARKLVLPEAAPVSARRRELGMAEGDGPDEKSFVSLREFATLAPEECVWEYADAEDAAAASRALAADGIESVVVPAGGRYGTDSRPPRLVVGPEDVDRAEQILSRPIAEEFRGENAGEDTYVEPVCPACAAAEPVLEAVDPANEWRCEACGHVWVDAEPA